MTHRTPASGPYHHGDLPNALRAAGAQLVAERGPAGFSLREVARRAGVSHAAPAHHFGDRRGLLTSIAVEAFEHLYQATSVAAGSTDDPAERLARTGRSYVELGLRHPGHCAVMFRHDLVDAEDPGYRHWADRAYGVLKEVVRDLAVARNPDLDVDCAVRLCWSAMQGLLALYPNMVELAELHGESAVGSVGELAEQFSELLVDGLVGRGDRGSPTIG